MKVCRKAAFAALTLAASSLWAADPGVTFIGRGKIAGNELDKSGLTGNICPIGATAPCGIDKKTFGGFGSALAYTGHDNVFLAVPDRGPFDGRTDVSYLDRFHFLHITVDTSVLPSSGAFNITTTLLDTRFLKSEANQNFVGDTSAFNVVNPLAALRFDPEGVAISHDGTFFIADEYGPYINEFNRQGHLVRRIPVPAKFLISNPTGQADSVGNSFELYPTTTIPTPPGGGNNAGRQANRGMEGLAITPDGRYLVGIMQNSLIQDNGLSSSTPPGRKGLNTRILKYDLLTGQTKEFVYTVDGRPATPPDFPLLPGQGRGVNEILAINDHEFLVLERDNRSKVPTPPNVVETPNLKRLYKIDLNKPGLTDVSGIASLPQSGAELASASPAIVAVTKTLFLDLLDPIYEVNLTTTPHTTIKDVVAEKLEGMAWGPDLPNGRHVLYITSDNDLYPLLPTQIYAFAIDAAAAGISYEAQDLPGPLYPPGQVKKAVDDKDDKK